MRDYNALYKIIQKQIYLVQQDYVTSNLADFRKHFKEINEFIDTLGISEKEKETLRLSMEYHRLLIEQCLHFLAEANNQCSKAMAQRFTMLPPENQKAAISTYRNLFAIKGSN